MRIERIEIAAFGKLKDFCLDLKDGFEVVYGHNEDGKSTLMAFIKMMFYSRQSNSKTDLDKNIRKKYMPWDGSRMEGAVTFIKDGNSYRIEKIFGPTAGRDQLTITNLNTGEGIALSKEEETGVYFFGLSLADFERSGYIGQSGCVVGSSGSLAQKLIENTVSSGDESVSHTEIMERLNKAAEDLVSKRGDKGILISAKNRLQELKSEKARLTKEYAVYEAQEKELQILQAQEQKKKACQAYQEYLQDSEDIGNLEKLLEEMKQFDAEKALLDTSGISWALAEQTKDMLTDLLKEADRCREALKAFGTENKDFSESNMVTKEEYEQLTAMAEKTRKLEIGRRLFEDQLLPTMQRYQTAEKRWTEAEKVYQEVRSRCKQLETEVRHYQSACESEQKALSQAKQLAFEIENRLLLLEQKKHLQKEEADFTRQRIEQEASGRQQQVLTAGSNPVLTVCAVVILVICAAGGIWIHPLLWGGILLGGLLLAFSLKNQRAVVKGSRSSQSADAVLDYRELEQLERRHQEAVTAVMAEINGLKQQQEGYVEEAKAARKRQLELADKKLEYQRLREQEEERRQERAQTENKIELQKEQLTHQQMQLQEEGFIARVSWPPAESEVLNSAFAIKQEILNLDSQIRQILAVHSCRTLKEYEQRYYALEGDRQVAKAREQARVRLQEQEDKLMAAVCSDIGTVDYDVAADHAEALIRRIQSAAAAENRIQIIGKSLKREGITVRQLETELMDFRTAQKNKIDPLYAAELESLTRSEFDQLLAKLQDENYSERMLQLSRNMRHPERDLETVNREIGEVLEEIGEKQKYYDALCLARQRMDAAKEELRQNFAPELNRRTAAILTRLTDGKYGQVYINKDFEIRVEDQGRIKEWQYLSSGTIEQTYLSLRLAVAEIIAAGSGNIPIFMDDVFAQYDEHRLGQAIRYLKEYAAEKGNEFQVILFTCHKNICEKMENEGCRMISLHRG